MKTLDTHISEVNEIIKKFHLIQKTHECSQNANKTFSNTMRKAQYRNFRKELGVDLLTHVVEIDEINMTVLCEPGCPMDELAKVCSKFNLMVPVMPEFKGITVGGAINGAAIESSSHLFGQFNDICLNYEILTGNGELIEASPENHSDLFYGISGAYGSLGIITLIKIKLIPKKTFVHLIYHRFKEIAKALEFLNNACISQNPPEFIEGIIFDLEDTVIIEGRPQSHNPNNLPIYKLSRLKPFFFQHVKDTENLEELIFTEDYLFRHDRGAFWMGAYGGNFKLLSRYYLENRLGLKIFKKLNREKNAKLKPTTTLFRYLLGWWMTSRKLYRMLHKDSENWFKDNFIIQDYYVPFDNTQEFLECVINETGIFPIWLCPVLGTEKPQFFSPHYQPNMKNKAKLYIDVGIYGMPNSSKELKGLNRLLDNSAKNLEARKMLYSFNYYTENEFFEIYSRQDYLNLRKKYHADVWVDLFNKL